MDLGALIGGESYGVEIVLIHELHGLHDLGVDIHVNQLGFLVVMVVFEAHLQLEPILNGYEIKDLLNQLKTSHLISRRSSSRITVGCHVVGILQALDVTLGLSRREDVLFHEAVANDGSVLSDEALDGRWVHILAESLARCPTPRLFTLKIIDDLLQLLRNVERALKQIAQGEDLLVLSLFTDIQKIDQTDIKNGDLLIPDDRVPDVLLADHGLDRLRNGALVIEDDQLLIVRKQVPDRVLLEEVSDIAFHFAIDLGNLCSSTLLLVVVDDLLLVAHLVILVIAAAFVGG